MRKIIFIFGIIAGLINEASMTTTMLLGVHGGMAGMLLGYASMIIAFSMIFVGIKRYRDNELGGIIKFKTALLLGLGIAGIASIIYVLGWEIYMFASNYTFMEEYTKTAIEAMRANGASAAEITTYQTQMAQMAEQYKNPVFRMLMTLTEIAPVGLIMALIAAMVLKRGK